MSLLSYHALTAFARKHMEKHTRPYSCLNPACNDVNFADKAGLQRHEKEKHGTVKVLCPVSSCPRHKRGFPRKRNLESHIVARHQKVERSVNAIFDKNSESPKSIENDDNEDFQAFGGVVKASGHMDRLKTKLQELETRKKELVESQAKVDADIQAVQRTMQLVFAREI
jgi:hypothetical protein